MSEDCDCLKFNCLQFDCMKCECLTCDCFKCDCFKCDCYISDCACADCACQCLTSCICVKECCNNFIGNICKTFFDELFKHVFLVVTAIVLLSIMTGGLFLIGLIAVNEYKKRKRARKAQRQQFQQEYQQQYRQQAVIPNFEAQGQGTNQNDQELQYVVHDEIKIHEVVIVQSNQIQSYDNREVRQQPIDSVINTDMQIRQNEDQNDPQQSQLYKYGNLLNTYYLNTKDKIQTSFNSFFNKKPQTQQEQRWAQQQ